MPQLLRPENVQRALPGRRQRGHITLKQPADQGFDLLLRGRDALAGAFLSRQTLRHPRNLVALMDYLVGLVGGQYVLDK